MSFASKILIVDDQIANTELLEALLRQEGYLDVNVLNDSRGVRQFVQLRQPDLILLDLRMPHLDGFQVLDQLFKDHTGDEPFVMVLTAESDSDLRNRALAHGALDFLSKPFDQREITHRVRNLLMVKHRSRLFEERVDELERALEEDSLNDEEARRLSMEDPVTRLPNRRGTLLRLLATISRRRSIAVYFVEIDGVLEITKLRGHNEADRVMFAVAEKLRSTFDYPGLFISYWGGYSLVVIDEEGRSDQMRAMAERLIRVIAGDHNVGGSIYTISARIGGTWADADLYLGEESIRRALISLPEKHAGQLIRFYDDELEAQIQRRNTISLSIHQGLVNGEFSLVYQPQCRTSNYYISGVEALARWEHPELGTISPDEFITIAESTGQIAEISSWVFETALSQLNKWIENGLVDSKFIMAVNLSSQQLKIGSLPTEFHALMSRYPRISPSQIEVEITETEMVNNLSEAVTQIEYLRATGVLVALDDFGTGFSSLSYLSRLPLDVLKIDRSFVSSMLQHHKDHQLVETIVAIAKVFGYRLVAEGIETPEQLHALKRLGCEYGQGYFISRPLDANTFERLLSSATGRYLALNAKSDEYRKRVN
ncbi:MAG TPA: EAL domain-containing protein [Marinobacterium sp.]|nr:EAL domain-containing protein [Marinobacterium sp.]